MPNRMAKGSGSTQRNGDPSGTVNAFTFQNGQYQNGKQQHCAENYSHFSPSSRTPSSSQQDKENNSADQPVKQDFSQGCQKRRRRVHRREQRTQHNNFIRCFHEKQRQQKPLAFLRRQKHHVNFKHSILSFSLRVAVHCAVICRLIGVNSSNTKKLSLPCT